MKRRGEVGWSEQERWSEVESGGELRRCCVSCGEVKYYEVKEMM